MAGKMPKHDLQELDLDLAMRWTFMGQRKKQDIVFRTVNIDSELQ